MEVCFLWWLLDLEQNKWVYMDHSKINQMNERERERECVTIGLISGYMIFVGVCFGDQ